MAAQRCTATTKSGQACRAFAVTGRTTCARHTPELRARCLEGSRRGGATPAGAAAQAPPALPPISTRGLDLETADGLSRYVARVLKRLGEMPFQLGVAHAVAQVVGAQLRVRDTGILEERVNELEEMIAARLGSR